MPKIVAAMTRGAPGREAAASLRVGTSGWTYPNWRELFYPRRLKQAEWLGFYARHFTTVELNASFYRLPTPAMIERWLALTPTTCAGSLSSSQRTLSTA